eukprot:CAMPEP_0197546008 /NCGR_PEP_ID=MMETSP1320-20131121/809_1 /TAXON_ID=91990 /ORGANISM="Bolidomonas sp., Strain RCC2347" /LENGTH=408 /DNA_ID=CAMNT_0043105555 /DNA_START=169 /DNA_END=1393 /DNA_ORIENTATION=+
MAGTGILQLPYTINQGGWLALSLVVVVGLMTNWTGKLLISSLYLNPSGYQRLEGYPEIGEAAFGRFGYYFVQFFHKATLFGVSTIFLVLAAKFLLEGLGGGGEGILNHAVDFDPSIDWTSVWTIVAAAFVLFPVVYYRTLGENHVLSLLGALSTVLAIAVVVFFAIYLNPIGASDANMDDDAYIFSPPTHKLIDWKLFPSAFSAIVLSFGGAATFPTIEGNMKQPHHFPRVLNKAFAVLVALYLVTAVAGYYTFGDLTFSPILCNLPRSDDLQGRVVQVTKLFVAFHVLTAYPILMSALVAEVECKFPFFRSTLPRTFERSALVGLTCLIAVKVPFFGPLMTFVGAGCLTMIVFVCPVVFNFTLRAKRGMKVGVAEKVAGAVVVISGLIGGSIGVAQSTSDLVNSLEK